jgi:ankyrin repeat protein
METNVEKEKLNESFIAAVINGDIPAAEKLLEEGADLNFLTNSKNNALAIAMNRLKGKMFDWLLSYDKNGQKINVDNVALNGEVLLLKAIREGDFLPYVKSLLKAGANPNIVASDGMTPLIRAVADGKLEEVKAILEDGRVDINYAIKETGTTAFLMAATASVGGNSKEICKLLLKHGANINAIDQHGKNALINSLFTSTTYMKNYEKEDHKKMYMFLCDLPFDVNFVAKSGMTAFWVASAMGYFEAAEKLLSKGVNPDVSHSIGVDPEVSALGYWLMSSDKVINQLVAEKMNGFITELANNLKIEKSEAYKLIDEEKAIAIRDEVKKRFLDFIFKAISMGAKINKPDEEMNTPGVYAFLNKETFTEAIKMGADVNGFFYQKDSKDPLKKNKIKIPLLSLIINNYGDKSFNIIKEMVSLGAVVSYDGDKDLESRSPILSAIKTCAVKTVELLLSTEKINLNKVYPSGGIKNGSEYSPLSFLVMDAMTGDIKQFLEQKKQISALIEAYETNEKNGVTSDLLDKEGYEELKKSLVDIETVEAGVVKMRRDIFNLMISYGADLNFKDNFGRTAVFYVNDSNFIDLLESAGANIFEVDNKGNTPLVFAIKNGNVEVVENLFKKYKEANNKSIDNIFYDLAFENPANEYERNSMINGIVALLSEEERKQFFENEKNNANLKEGEEVKRILVNGIDNCDADLVTPLMVACATDKPYLVSLYVNMGANVNHVNNNGETPLMHAIASDNHRIVEFLIKNGADLNVATKSGQTVLEMATEINNKNIMDLVNVGLGITTKDSVLNTYKKISI